MSTAEDWNRTVGNMGQRCVVRYLNAVTMACLELFWSVSVRGHWRSRSLPPAFDRKLMILNVRCMHNASGRTITYGMCEPADAASTCAEQRWPFCRGCVPWYPLSPIPAALHSAWHAFISPSAAAAHKDLFICLLTPVRKPLTNILGKSLGLWGSHMCEPVAGAHAVPSLFVRVFYRGIKMSSVRCASLHYWVCSSHESLYLGRICFV